MLLWKICHICSRISKPSTLCKSQHMCILMLLQRALVSFCGFANSHYVSHQNVKPHRICWHHLIYIHKYSPSFLSCWALPGNSQYDQQGASSQLGTKYSDTHWLFSFQDKWTVWKGMRNLQNSTCAACCSSYWAPQFMYSGSSIIERVAANWKKQITCH
jgi:hypothetical protein